ncbi:MAG: hypothetical protein QXG39_03315 [Candidatus Aenigmatarchaeota archaeon]
MLSLKTNNKGEIKKLFSTFLTYVFTYNWEKAMEEVLKLEDSIVQHLLTRGNDTEAVREIFTKIKYWIRTQTSSETKKNVIMEKIDELLRLISVKKIPSNSNPISLLKDIYQELREDWMDFWSDPDEGKIQNLVDDLDMIEMLESSFRKEENEEIYKQFRRILAKRSACYTNIPILNAMARGNVLHENTRGAIFTSFQMLFKEIEKLLAPEYFVYEEEEEEKPEL